MDALILNEANVPQLQRGRLEHQFLIAFQYDSVVISDFPSSTNLRGTPSIRHRRECSPR